MAGISQQSTYMTPLIFYHHDGLITVVSGWPPIWKPGKVGEFESGQGK